jgi:hypothetical protein
MGGATADISVEQSAEGLMQQFANLQLASTGRLEDHQGERLPY